MKFLRLDLLTLLISLFILNSCKNNDTIGLPVDAGNQVSGTQVIDKNLTVNTKLIDSVVTSALAKTPLAYFKDPLIGTTEANIQAGLDLPLSTAYTLPTGTITTDSAVLVLRYNDGFYGDSLNSDYKINVYQAAAQLSTSKAYYNNTTEIQPANSTVIGTRSFKPYTHTVFKVTSIVVGKPDTLIKVPAQLRVPISTSFINSNFWNASSGTLASNTLFRTAIKGLYMTLDKNQRGEGGNIMFNLDSSHVDVYYKAVSGTTIDTSVVSLPITPSYHAAQIKHTYTSAVQSALSNAASNNTFYLQSGGLQAKVAFPNLTTLFGTTNAKNVVLNRAELVITPSPTTFITYVPQPKLSLYRYDIAKQPTLLPDATSGDKYFLSSSIFNGFYSTSLQSYHFIVTGYIQNLLRGTYPDYGTFIVPVDTTNKTTVDYTPTAQSAGRTVAIGTDPTSGYSIRLNIIYNTVNP